MNSTGISGSLIHPDINFLESFRELLTDQSANGQRRISDPEFDASHLEMVKHIESLDHTHYWWVDENVVVGRIRLRDATTGDFYESHGDIGYDMSPRFQNRGYATAMLKAVIEIARKQQRNHLLITCKTSNIASRRVIEKNGGILRDIYEEDFYRFDFELS